MRCIACDTNKVFNEATNTCSDAPPTGLDNCESYSGSNCSTCKSTHYAIRNINTTGENTVDCLVKASFVNGGVISNIANCVSNIKVKKTTGSTYHMHCEKCMDGYVAKTDAVDGGITVSCTKMED